MQRAEVVPARHGLLGQAGFCHRLVARHGDKRVQERL